MRNFTGFKRDSYDERDYIFSSSTTDLPESVDLRPLAGECDNQLHLGSCVAHAVTNQVEILDKVDKQYSRLFMYSGRTLNTVDEGMSIREALKFTSKNGVPEESEYPYDTSKVLDTPPKEVFDKAVNNKVIDYYRIHSHRSDTVENVKKALVDGYSVSVGMWLTKDFYKLKDVKKLDTAGYVGVTGNDRDLAHAMLIVGYTKDGFIIENSWGTEWGADGFCLISFDVVYRDTMDFWVVTKFGKLKRSKVYLDKDEDFVIAQDHAIIYGNSGYETLTVQDHVYGLGIDSSIDYIKLPNDYMRYYIRQVGISLEIYDRDVRRVITLQSPTQKLKAGRYDIPIEYSGGVMKVRGRELINNVFGGM